MELQIEKDAVPPRDQRLDDGGATAGEEPAPDLHSAGDSTKTVRESKRLVCGINVERNYELIHSLSRAFVSTVPMMSVIRSTLWRCRYSCIPSSSFGQM